MTVVSFTFDDGFVDQLDAARVLEEHGMRGTFYVNSARLDASSPLYLTRSQTDDLVAAGHEIGGHTLGHVDLAAVSAAEATRQICEDRGNLLALGYEVTSFAYPFGSTNTAVKQIVEGCGYSSARGVGDLRSPGSGCAPCRTAETVPPSDRWKIRTNSSVKSDTTVATLQTYVEQAEQDGGGWVPLVFHGFCADCAANAVDPDTFRTFVAWLAERPATTRVLTVAEVVVGAGLGPPAVPVPSPTPTVPVLPPAQEFAFVTAGAHTRTVEGTDVRRTVDGLVRYTPAHGPTTGTNEYGAEAAVVDGVVTRFENGVGDMAIPVNGYVLSGHGAARAWLRAHAAVGTRLELSTTPPPPVKTTPTRTKKPARWKVRMTRSQRRISGTNVYRSTGTLVRYTPRWGKRTGSNAYGTEVVVVAGRITRVVHGVGNVRIPRRGYVLSGHGAASTWLRSHASVGARVVLRKQRPAPR